MPTLHVALVFVRVQIHDEKAAQVSDGYAQDDGQEAWAHQLMQERHEIAVQALSRCLAAGAKEEDVRTLARECGIDPKYIEITEQKV